MNSRVRKQDLEKLLFLDIETTRRNKILNINSKEYDLYAWKLRDKETSKLPPSNEVIKHYELNGALDPTFNKIVCISVGFINGGTLYLKSFVGEQKEIIDGFYKLLNSTGFTPSGHNIINFDMPTIRLKAFESGVDLELLLDKYSDSQQKPWIISDNFMDTMDITKGTYYYNLSLDAMCMLGGIDTPKDDILGADVSRVYYEEGVARISTYCKKDVKAVAELFCALQGKKGFIKNIIDKDLTTGVEHFVQEQTLLQQIFATKTIKTEEFQKLLKSKKHTKKEKDILIELIKGLISEINVNFGSVVNSKEVEEIIESLKLSV